jgi:hypothetical protein
MSCEGDLVAGIAAAGGVVIVVGGFVLAAAAALTVGGVVGAAGYGAYRFLRWGGGRIADSLDRRRAKAEAERRPERQWRVDDMLTRSSDTSAVCPGDINKVKAETYRLIDEVDTKMTSDKGSHVIRRHEFESLNRAAGMVEEAKMLWQQETRASMETAGRLAAAADEELDRAARSAAEKETIRINSFIVKKEMRRAVHAAAEGMGYRAYDVQDSEFPIDFVLFGPDNEEARLAFDDEGRVYLDATRGFEGDACERFLLNLIARMRAHNPSIQFMGLQLRPGAVHQSDASRAFIQEHLGLEQGF